MNERFIGVLRGRGVVNAKPSGSSVILRLCTLLLEFLDVPYMTGFATKPPNVLGRPFRT